MSEYRVRRSTRARRVSVSVTPDGLVEVTLPKQAPERDAQRAVSSLQPWIKRQLAKHQQLQVDLQVLPGQLPLLGRQLPYVVEADRTRAGFSGGYLKLPATDPELAAKQWYRQLARKEIMRRLPRLEKAVGVSSTGIAIRDQKTRWGSCSSSGLLSFNWRLLLAPDQVFEYVLWHEVCHLRVPNHSTEFWQLLEKHCSNYQGHANWLKRYGPALALGQITTT